MVAALESKGFKLSQGNRDHDFLFFGHQGITQAIFTKVSRGSAYKTLGDPLLSKMSRQVKLTKGEFLDLVDCPMSEHEYLARLVAQGLVQDKR